MTLNLYWSMAGMERRPLLPAMLVLSAFFSADVAFAQGGTIGNFPTVDFPRGNPPTPAKVQLGKALFFEEQVSSDYTMSCASCHFSELGGVAPDTMSRAPGLDGLLNTADDVFGATGVIEQDANSDYVHNPVHGVGRQVTSLNPPSVIGAAFFKSLLWELGAKQVFGDLEGNVVLTDRAALESQAVIPFLSSVEMAHANRNWDQVTDKLGSVRPLALASDLPASLIDIVADNPNYHALFDNAFGTPEITRERIAMAIASYERELVADQSPFDLGTMTPEQVRGQQVFLTRGFCTTCHSLSNDLFSDGRRHNIGLPNHNRLVKTPSLRNVGLRPRFMHSGQFTRLEEVLAHYKSIGFLVSISSAEDQDLIAFLSKGLMDPRVLRREPPFDRPTLNSERQPIGSNLYGKGSAGTGGVTPIMIAHSPPNVGNTDFKIGISATRSDTVAILAASHTALPVGTHVGGVPLLIEPLDGAVVLVPLDGSGNTQTTATFKLPIAADHSLVGAEVFAQWFVLDANAVGGIATTPAARFLAF